MDLMFFAEMKLVFIRQFYATASAPFRETIRKIDAQEPPFELPQYEEAPTDEPPFVKEYTEAQDSLTMLGLMSLSFVSSVLHKHLEAWLTEKEMKLPSGRKGGWLQRYREFFRDELGIDWETGPVPFAELEQLVLARNDIEHQLEVMTIYAEMSEDHKGRYPNSPYQDRYGFGYVEVTAESFEEVCGKVRDFVAFLESFR